MFLDEQFVDILTLMHCLQNNVSFFPMYSQVNMFLPKLAPYEALVILQQLVRVLVHSTSNFCCSLLIHSDFSLFQRQLSLMVFLIVLPFPLQLQLAENLFCQNMLLWVEQ